MRVLKETFENIEVLKLQGDLDALGVLEVEPMIIDVIERSQYIAIDCADLNYISSAGLGLFIKVTDKIKQQAGNMVFYNMSEKVKNVFVILGLQNVFKILESFDAAVANLKSK